MALRPARRSDCCVYAKSDTSCRTRIGGFGEGRELFHFHTGVTTIDVAEQAHTADLRESGAAQGRLTCRVIAAGRRADARG